MMNRIQKIEEVDADGYSAENEQEYPEVVQVPTRENFGQRIEDDEGYNSENEQVGDQDKATDMDCVGTNDGCNKCDEPFPLDARHLSNKDVDFVKC